MTTLTHWYHSHSRFQEQTGLYGPLIIEPRNGERFPAEREHVVMLSDWTDTNPDYQFAPYIGVSWRHKLGNTADFSRAAGEDVGETQFVAGVRIWF